MGHQQNVASDLITPVILERATASMRVSPPKNNFDVLIRVLEEPDYLGGGEIDDDVSSVHSVLTEEERFRLREVIMTDERIQTILKETHTTERMMMLKDYRKIEKVVSPQKWDVLIRIIDNADQAVARSCSCHCSRLICNLLSSIWWCHIQRRKKITFLKKQQQILKNNNKFLTTFDACNFVRYF